MTVPEWTHGLEGSNVNHSVSLRFINLGQSRCSRTHPRRKTAVPTSVRFSNCPQLSFLVQELFGHHSETIVECLVSSDAWNKERSWLKTEIAIFERL